MLFYIILQSKDKFSRIILRNGRSFLRHNPYLTIKFTAYV